MKRYWIEHQGKYKIIATTIAIVTGCAIFLNGIEGTVVGEYFK